LERKEATALLREIVNASLIQQAYVHLKQNDHCHFDLIMKDCDPIEIRKYIVSKDLPLLVDHEKGICRIYKP
jgi:hypothetical protein